MSEEKQDTFEKVRKIICDLLVVEPDKVVENTSLIHDLGADSLDAVEIVLAVEEEFNVAIPDEDAEKLTTVGEIVRYLEERKGGAR